VAGAFFRQVELGADLQDQPPLDNDDFLHDRDDRDVPLLTNWRHDINGQVDRNSFDLDPNLGQLLVDQSRRE
jgi:hypothetical protein